MIAEPGATLTIRCIEMASGAVNILGFCWSQFRAIAGARSFPAGGEIAPLLLCRHLASFKRGQFGTVTGLHPVVAVGHIPLVIGHGQSNRFRFSEF